MLPVFFADGVLTVAKSNPVWAVIPKINKFQYLKTLRDRQMDDKYVHPQ